ncbi:hypothetical protein EG328_010452 [Venturia inaequalis]|uniref:Vacuolar protein-sorting-associated protein 25 n=1 Tax=Venturia inaequalis TaxID=5025 RepID=A0A8H3V7P3_VENIN|nr:hypothetical protein EG328_010452 [Venturia inaequalis]KAE9993586.1 hypothetical protein EG327_004345 [Venturia inaequalis]RDI78904.1 hypothetical protein Vi05172_g11053 [Venturia inaequalis]
MTDLQSYRTSSPALTPATTITSTDKPFAFPPHYSFPPFFTLQPNPLTLSSQLASWSSLILSYCRHNRIFQLSPVETFNTELFHNETINRKLSIPDILTVLTYMSTKEGNSRVEWVGKPPGKGGAVGSDGGGGRCWIFWRRPEEWADLILRWVEEMGQRGVVLTMWELGEGDGTRGWDFHGMDEVLLQRSVGVLVKRGKAQVFGEMGAEGVKFF